MYDLSDLERKKETKNIYVRWNRKRKKNGHKHGVNVFSVQGSALTGATRRGKRISRIVLLGGWMAVMVGVRRPRASTINVYKRRIEMREWGKVRSRRRQPQTYHGRSVVRGTWHALRLFVSLPWILLRITSLSSHSLVLCFSFAFALSFSCFSPAFPPFRFSHFYPCCYALLYFCTSFLFFPHFFLPPFLSSLLSSSLSLSFLLFERIQLDSTVRCCVNQNNRFDRSGWKSCSCRNIINIVSGIQRKIYDSFHAIFV